MSVGCLEATTKQIMQDKTNKELQHETQIFINFSNGSIGLSINLFIFYYIWQPVQSLRVASPDLI
jgi:hypothetical protein